MPEYNVTAPAIVLDADIRSQEGIIQSLGGHGIPVIAVSSQQDCPAFHSKYVTETYVSPCIEDDATDYVVFLEKIVPKGVLIYSDDVNTLTLAAYQERLRKAGFLINMPEKDILEKVFDKWTCAQVSASLGVNVPRTQIVKTRADVEKIWDEFQKPVILKGTRLAGGLYEKLFSLDEVDSALKILRCKIESDEYRARKSDIILQEYLEYSMTDIWCSETVYTKHSKPMGHFTIRKIRPSFLSSGEFGSRMFAGEYAYSREIIDMTDRLLSAMKWQGFAHLDLVFQPKDNKFYLLEVNPRLPGFSFYPSRAGYEMAYLYYLDLIGTEPESVSDTHPASIYFETFRSPGDFTSTIIYMLKGKVSFRSYIRSYLRLLSPGLKKVVEPVRLEDMGFTLRSIGRDSKRLLTWLLRGALKKIAVSGKK